MAYQLVTGGAGFIGSHIVTALAERGEQVRVLDNLSSGFLRNLEHLNGAIDFIQGDAADPEVVARAMHGVEYVFHQAALASVPASLRDPLASHTACATATVNVLQAAQRAGVKRVLLAASSAAYGDLAEGAKKESDPLAPLSPYAAAKIASEFYCQAFAKSLELETVALRYFNVYGPRQDPHSEYSAVIPRFVHTMLQGQQPTVFGDGRQSRDFVYVGDVVQANLLAAEQPEANGGVFNIAGGGPSTLLELIEAINAALGSAIEPLFTPPREGDILHSSADISRARDLLGFAPQVNLATGLARSIDYYRSLVT